MMKTNDLDLDPLPGNVLRDIARNESADPKYRKAAVSIMFRKGYKEANHPDLSALLAEVKAEKVAEQEVEDIATTAIEGELPTAPAAVADEDEEPGPFKAGFTTRNF